MVNEQKFKDLLNRTCQISSERKVLNLESDVQEFNVNILLLGYFVFM